MMRSPSLSLLGEREKRCGRRLIFFTPPVPPAPRAVVG
jgi:hypothetical protein